MITIQHIDSVSRDALGVRLEHLFTYKVTFALPPEFIGPAPDGIRINFTFTGGEVTGLRIRGRIRSGGADWLTVRPDGVGMLDIRATIETDDGALIYAPYQGILDHGEDGYRQALSGTLLPNGTSFQVAPRFQTAHPDYAWLNRLQCIGIGQVFPDLGEARCAVYAIH